MKLAVLSAVALACAAGVASADVFGDPVLDIFDPSFTHLDITQVTITNDATWLNIGIQVAGDAAAVDWGKYAIGFQTGALGNNSNAWGRNIDWGRDISHWSALWADSGGGAEIYSWDFPNSAWQLDDATYAAGTDINHDLSQASSGLIQWRLRLSSLGLGVGSGFNFDIVTTGGGGGDPGIDHLSVSGLATPGWGDTSFAGTFIPYTVQPVPSPASAALLGLGGLVGLRRRR